RVIKREADQARAGPFGDGQLACATQLAPHWRGMQRDIVKDGADSAGVQMREQAIARRGIARQKIKQVKVARAFDGHMGKLYESRAGQRFEGLSIEVIDLASPLRDRLHHLELAK